MLLYFQHFPVYCIVFNHNMFTVKDKFIMKLAYVESQDITSE